MKAQHKFTVIFFFIVSSLFGQDYTLKINESQHRIEFVNKDKVLLVVDSIKFNYVLADKYKIIQQSDSKIQLQVHFSKVSDFNKVESEEDHDVLINFERKGDTWHIFTHPEWANDISIFMKDVQEHYFGICEGLQPDNDKSPDLRGKIVDFKAEGESSRIYENYASAWSAFYMSSNGYGSFFNTFAEGQYKFAINGQSEIYHRTGKLDWYLFFGTNGNEIITQYYNITGSPKKVPLWSCGTLFWRDENKGGKDEILNDVKKYTEAQIPLSTVYVDRPYSNGKNGWSEMDFSPEFANPAQWIGILKNQYNLRFMTWIGSCTFMDTSFPGILPGFMSYLDLSNPAAVKEFDKRLNAKQYAVGVVGHKMDRAEEFFPEGEPWYDGTPISERRNKYIFLYSKVVDSILTAHLGVDNFNFSRTAMQGSHKYLSALWGGDVRPSFAGMSGNLANAIRCGFLGYPDWGTDCGGYLGEKGRISEELYYRWVQWATWVGLFEVKIDGAGGKGEDRAPWKYSEAFLKKYRDASIEHMQLVPYVYSKINNAAKEGVLMKPLAYVDLSDTKTYNIWNEYIFGNDFLVAPVTNTDSVKNIYFPAGNWIDWYAPTNTYAGKTTAVITLSKDHIPVYVRENALFITGNNILIGNTKCWKKNLTPELFVHAFPGKENFSSEFTYVDLLDNNKLKVFNMTQSNGIATIHIEAVNEKSSLVIHTPTKVKEIKLDGKAVKYSFNAKTETISIALPKAKGCTLEIIK